MKLPESYYNRLSFLGTIIAVTALILISFVFIVMFGFGEGGNYTGILLFLVLPGFLVFGLMLIPLGMWLRARNIRKNKIETARKRTVIDFNNPRHRNASFLFLIGTIIFLIISTLGSYEAFHLTESNAFCGTLCHTVMEPEYSTYQTSAHARVKCVECHVGSGANWYVKSKISGLYQVYSVMAKKYPTPIPTPIESLRPARETCEQCHWPEKFYSNRLHNEIHYLADSTNTRWDIVYQMKIGPSHSSKGHSEGIHWHINSNTKIEYISSTDDREFIPWVKYINLETGDTVIYEDSWNPPDSALFADHEVRTMDCMDCHNRPSHQFETPQDYIDHAIAKGDISSVLPEIKKLCMEIFNTSFPTTDSAFYAIQNEVNNLYENKYPTLYKNKKAEIDQSISGIQAAFAANNFPIMQSNWDSYPNQKGHIEYNGCFRCHDNNHESTSGEIIRKDCNLCHEIMMQGTPEENYTANYNNSLEFKHPVNIDLAWVDYNCTDCHRYLY